jgi:hypothetical protein
VTLNATLEADNTILKFDQHGNASVFADVSDGLNFPVAIMVGTCPVKIEVIAWYLQVLKSPDAPCNERCSAFCGSSLIWLGTFISRCMPGSLRIEVAIALK